MPTFNIKDIPESKIVKLVDLSEDSINKIAEAVARKIKEPEQLKILNGDTVDAMKVIRCKDCKWRGKLGCAVRIVDESDMPNDDDFCAWGEREDADSN